MDMYHGTLGNCVRTRYRISDELLSDAGVQALEEAGLALLVHGHSDGSGSGSEGGQQLSRLGGLIDLDCDVTINAHRRAMGGMEDVGAAAVLLQSSGLVCALSLDREHGRWIDCRGDEQLAGSA